MSDVKGLKVKSGDWIAVRIRKITLKDDWIYLTLEIPGIDYPNVNYPTLRIFKDKIGEIEPLITREEAIQNE